MAASADFKQFLADLLSGFGPVTFKRAFGLDAIMAGEVMMGFISDETIYFRAEAATRAAFEAEGGKPFEFDMKPRRVVTSYLSIPERLLDDPDELVKWARLAHAAALETPTARKKRAAKARGMAPRRPARRKAAR